MIAFLLQKSRCGFQNHRALPKPPKKIAFGSQNHTKKQKHGFLRDLVGDIKKQPPKSILIAICGSFLGGYCSHFGFL